MGYFLSVECCSIPPLFCVCAVAKPEPSAQVAWTAASNTQWPLAYALVRVIRLCDVLDPGEINYETQAG
jgi:hypothetical protein